MPTVEDYFDDDTDLPLPQASSSSSSSRPRHLAGHGLQGALLEEITDDAHDFDLSKLAEQARGEYGADSRAPAPGASAPMAYSGSADKGKMAMRDGGADDALRPLGPQGPQINPNTPMGGFMGDMMRLQEAEEARLAKVRSQYGSTAIAPDPSVYKAWNSVYPLYFDAKVSINDGRRVARKAAIWWPQATHIAKACAALGLPAVLEPERTHPADWENPGRVKVQFVHDGKFVNPIVKNRTQLYAQLAAQMQRAHPSLVPQPAAKSTQPKSAKADDAVARPKGAAAGKGGKPARPLQPQARRRLPTRPPRAPQPAPPLDDRLPLHSPAAATGVAVSSVKRDLEAEKENKKKGIANDEGGGGAGKDKPPKMKRMVVRGRR